MKNVLPAFAAAAVLAATLAAPAEATRPIAGYDYPDLCRNKGHHAMPGVQTVLLFPMGFVQYVNPDQEPNRFGKRACEDGRRAHR